ncbi:DNA replication/repair protein RecF [Methylocapsa polymorpha]|uniref:DNA replication and repair protein RecF n=1 Tax=Methylocapsa polymorpha TaxID=3080828 RepID=A0ABZ0HXE9_9HYPH|nr:DNA replication/repair protein RecF [Methylocapsa sp. RX1]
METVNRTAPRHAESHGVRRLTLADFRSYASLDLAISAALVVVTGDNGAGKTNLIEALSLLTPGRGLRRAELSDFPRKTGAGGFAVSVELEGSFGRVQLGTGVECQENAPPARKYRLDREPAPSIRVFCDHVRVVWLTPSMDGLFAGPAGERRRFLDRLVLSVDADHGARVNAFERALRSRNRLLEEPLSHGDKTWLDAIEREVAELGIAVAAARSETVSLLSGLALAGRDPGSPFPWAELALRGEVETLVAERPALEAEDIYRAILRDSRARDAAAGRAIIGPQASDLCVRHGPKNVEAAQASTGEQKALLVGLVLAQARLVKTMSGLAPLILLDEIAAHFDPTRRQALYELLETLGGQIWLTGADPATFAGIAARAQMLKVTPGHVASLA